MTGRERHPTAGVPGSEGIAPDAPWVCCPGCGELIYGKAYAQNLNVCPICRRHGSLSAPQRIATLFDAGTVRPLRARPTVEDPLEFTDLLPFRRRLDEARATTGLDEAVRCVIGAIGGITVVAAVMDFRFLGGSLGCAVGERITHAAEVSLRERIPLLLVTASGGARMQEGALALMQMAKTSQALAALDEAGILTVSLITDPTYGGVAASFATLTDIILAEPGARMGFAGPRVIEQTIGGRLPPDFQSAERLLERGLVDEVQARGTLRPALARLLSVSGPQKAAGRRPEGSPADAADPGTGGAPAGEPSDAAGRWDAVRRAREIERPTTLDYAVTMMDGFYELHGDRMSAECSAVVGGVGWIGGRPVVMIGHQKGHSTRELVARNFGMPSPAGYRKAARLMRLADKLGIPVLTLIDTPGAHPGAEAEEQGQAVAIAENLRLMASLRVPIVAVVTGEGGSGGALALGVADRVLALSNAFYSVISPEGCAAILWRDATRAPEAATALRIDTGSLLRMKVIDRIVAEPDGGADREPGETAARLRTAVVAALSELAPYDPAELVRARRDRFRQFGLTTGEDRHDVDV